MNTNLFWTKVNKSGDCWLWTGKKDRHGYGRFNVNDKPRLAHRIAYELVNGGIEHDKDLHHICENKLCVRPSHLQPISRADHARITPNNAVEVNRQKTHCPKGHPYNAANTYTRKYGTREARTCRKCQLEAVRRYQQKTVRAA